MSTTTVRQGLLLFCRQSASCNMFPLLCGRGCIQVWQHLADDMQEMVEKVRASAFRVPATSAFPMSGVGLRMSQSAWIYYCVCAVM